MPFGYVIDPANELVVITMSGVLTGGVYEEATRAFLADPHWRPGFDRLWDGRAIRLIDAQPAEVRAYVGLAAAEQEALRQGRSALVVVRDAAVVLSQLLRALLPWEVEVFETLEEALAWLGKPWPAGDASALPSQPA